MLPLRAWNTLIHSILPHAAEVIIKEDKVSAATSVLAVSKFPAPSCRICNDSGATQRRAPGLPAASQMATWKGVDAIVLLYFKNRLQ